MGFSWIRARTRVPCAGRRILNHCTTKEVLKAFPFYISLEISSKGLRVEGGDWASLWLENEIVTEFVSARVPEGIDDMINMV